jgi:hypothetical protein
MWRSVDQEIITNDSCWNGLQACASFREEFERKEYVMRMIYLPIAAALALGLSSAAPITANADGAAPEDNPMRHMRYDDYYGGSVYVAPTYRPHAYREHYPYYHRSGPAYTFDDRYHRHHRPLIGLQLPFVGLHLG